MNVLTRLLGGTAGHHVPFDTVPDRDTGTLAHTHVRRADWDQLLRKLGHARWELAEARRELGWWRAEGARRGVSYRPLPTKDV
jgi:hypothetical protein